MKFSVVSTFSGCGGSSLGYQMAGGKVLLAVEWDQNAIDTYQLNFPDTPIYHGDISKLSVEECLERAGLQPGELDILDGSPPCQGFSTAGKRKFGDERNQLFKEFVRLLQGLKPKVFVMENVSGLVKGKMRLIFVEILKELKASGYRVRARLLNAMYFGVPQSRQRIIFVGVRNDLGIEPEYPIGRCRLISVSEAIGNLGAESDASTDHVWLDESPAGRNTKTYPLALRVRQGQKYAGQSKRDYWSKPAGTLIKPASEGMKMPPYLRGLNCHPIKTRTYSLLEMKRLSTFPDAFRFAGEWWRGFYCIGNSVPPLFMKAIAEHIKGRILNGRSLRDGVDRGL